MAEEESFKITDRRHRDAPADPLPPPRAEPAPPPSPPRAASAPLPPEGRDLTGPDLASLFVMFASSAMIALGEAPDPMSGERSIDLTQAREAVDILLLLREKTEGNRSEQENHLLEEILYDLQMRFVRATKGGSG
ncbi:MAG TPA: DUF1844 domain-containing protein [Methylomirabilota bacterium]|nr:DUF1844 domain-containing protein [Methylomirabilota bacterium]